MIASKLKLNQKRKPNCLYVLMHPYIKFLVGNGVMLFNFYLGLYFSLEISINLHVSHNIYIYLQHLNSTVHFLSTDVKNVS